jgi:hypothetical protein
MALLATLTEKRITLPHQTRNTTTDRHVIDAVPELA